MFEAIFTHKFTIEIKIEGKILKELGTDIKGMLKALDTKTKSGDNPYAVREMVARSEGSNATSQRRTKLKQFEATLKTIQKTLSTPRKIKEEEGLLTALLEFALFNRNLPIGARKIRQMALFGLSGNPNSKAVGAVNSYCELFYDFEEKLHETLQHMTTEENNFLTYIRRLDANFLRAMRRAKTQREEIEDITNI